MNGLQSWLFLVVLIALGLRGLDRLRLTAQDLGYIGAAAALAVLQHVVTRQFTLDEPIVAPLLLALPVIAGIRGGVRAGLACGAGCWLALTALAGVVPVRTPGDLPQELFLLASLFGTGLGAAAGAFRPERRWAAGLLPLAWIFLLAMRDGGLALVPTVLAVPVLAAAWASLVTALAPAPLPATEAV